jgi:hypothetical protein
VRSALVHTLAVAVLLIGACEDDAGPVDARPGVGDAPVDVPAAPGDAGALDVADARVSVDCPGIGCRDQAVFNIAGYLASFGEDGRSVDVTACVGSACGSVRALFTAQSATLSGQMGTIDTSVELYADGWLRVYVRGGAPPDAQQEVQLRIVTTTGRTLINYTGRATGEQHCPNGAGCNRCQALVVDVDPADAGQPVDSGDPARAGHCGP